jgi:hypothetical protein
MTRACIALTIVVFLFRPTVVRADVILDWNAIMVTTVTGQAPFVQARVAAITHLAVFEAVNAITRDYSPYWAQLSRRQARRPRQPRSRPHTACSSTTFPVPRRVSTPLERVPSL